MDDGSSMLRAEAAAEAFHEQNRNSGELFRRSMVLSALPGVQVVDEDDQQQDGDGYSMTSDRVARGVSPRRTVAKQRALKAERSHQKLIVEKQRLRDVEEAQRRARLEAEAARAQRQLQMKKKSGEERKLRVLARKKKMDEERRIAQKRALKLQDERAAEKNEPREKIVSPALLAAEAHQKQQLEKERLDRERVLQELREREEMERKNQAERRKAREEELRAKKAAAEKRKNQVVANQAGVFVQEVTPEEVSFQEPEDVVERAPDDLESLIIVENSRSSKGSTENHSSEIVTTGDSVTDNDLLSAEADGAVDGSPIARDIQDADAAAAEMADGSDNREANDPSETSDGKPRLRDDITRADHPPVDTLSAVVSNSGVSSSQQRTLSSSFSKRRGKEESSSEAHMQHREKIEAESWERALQKLRRSKDSRSKEKLPTEDLTLIGGDDWFQNALPSRGRPWLISSSLLLLLWVLTMGLFNLGVLCMLVVYYTVKNRDEKLIRYSLMALGGYGLMNLLFFSFGAALQVASQFFVIYKFVQHE